MPLFGLANVWDTGTATAVPTSLGGLCAATNTATTTAYYQVLFTTGSGGAGGLTNATTACYSALAQANTATTTGYYWGGQEVTPSQYMALARNRVVYCRERTLQELAEQAEQQRVANELYAQRAEAARIATERSRQLLLSHLTKQQRQTFESNLWFVVEGGRSKQRYRIHGNSYSGNIHVLQRDLLGDRATHRLCCHCADGVPLYDHLLAQKLHLQYDEDAFLRMANRH